MRDKKRIQNRLYHNDEMGNTLDIYDFLYSCSL